MPESNQGGEIIRLKSASTIAQASDIIRHLKSGKVPKMIAAILHMTHWAVLKHIERNPAAHKAYDDNRGKRNYTSEHNQVVERDQRTTRL